MILNYYYYWCIHLFKTSIVYFRCNSHNAVNTAQIMLITHCSNHEYTQSCQTIMTIHGFIHVCFSLFLNMICPFESILSRGVNWSCGHNLLQPIIPFKTYFQRYSKWTTIHTILFQNAIFKLVDDVLNNMQWRFCKNSSMKNWRLLLVLQGIHHRLQIRRKFIPFSVDLLLYLIMCCRVK